MIALQDQENRGRIVAARIRTLPAEGLEENDAHAEEIRAAIERLEAELLR